MADKKDQQGGVKHAKSMFERGKDLAKKVGSAAEGLFGMGGVSKTTGKAAGKKPSFGGGKYTPAKTTSAEMKERQAEADRKLEKERRTSRRRFENRR